MFVILWGYLVLRVVAFVASLWGLLKRSPLRATEHHWALGAMVFVVVDVAGTLWGGATVDGMPPAGYVLGAVYVGAPALWWLRCVKRRRSSS